MFPTGEYGVLIGGVQGDNSRTGLGYGVETDGGTLLREGGTGWVGVRPFLQTHASKFRWLADLTPGPVFTDAALGAGIKRRYSAFALIDVIDDSTGTRKPSWRANPSTGVQRSDTVNLAHVVNTWQWRREVATEFGLLYLQYLGMLQEPDSIALAQSNPAAWLVKWNRLLDYCHLTLKADAIAFDVANWIGSDPALRPSNTSQDVAALFSEAFVTAAKRRDSDPTFPLIVVEPRPLSALQYSSPRQSNTRLSPTALGRRSGTPGYINNNDLQFHHPSYTSDVLSYQHAPLADHRCFVADFTGVMYDDEELVTECVDRGDVVLFSMLALSGGGTDLIPPQSKNLANPIDDRSRVTAGRVTPSVRTNVRIPGR
jgi:hypothetical protein